MHYRHKKLIWQIFPANLVITLAAMLAVTWYGTSALRDFYYQQMTAGLQARAYLVRERSADLLAAGRLAELRDFIRKSGREARTRITVIDPAGAVVADSDENPAVMEPHGSRPEILTAYDGGIGSALRFSKTLQQTMLYVAIPLPGQEVHPGPRAEAGVRVAGVLRVAIPVTAISETLRDVQIRIGLGAIVVVLVAALITLLVSRRISRPLEEIRQSAERFSMGDFSRGMSLRNKEAASLEVTALADAMERMAGQLNERIRTISRQRNELETLFAGMAEGVIACDTEERVIRMNQAAAAVFAVDPREVGGKTIQEVIRNVDLQRQIREILTTLLPLQGEITAQEGQQERYLQTNGVPLYDGGRNIGVLVVLNDVTRLRRLENVRRDFVANVSHELKTPITSIKGYVETLLDGAIDKREEAVPFLRIVLKQSDLLYAIIEDLLALSRIEKQSEDHEVVLKKQMLYPVLEEAVLTCRMKAAEKNIHIALSCPEHLQARVNETLLEQAVVNLVVNAIKYSEANSEVLVRAAEQEDVRGGKRIVISVRDFGVGIARQHLPRLFERFYRSDKARSRKLGGTGLGLAIVKHIVQAHDGEVAVESREGEGSTFSILLPVVQR